MTERKRTPAPGALYVNELQGYALRPPIVVIVVLKQDKARFSYQPVRTPIPLGPVSAGAATRLAAEFGGTARSGAGGDGDE